MMGTHLYLKRILVLTIARCSEIKYFYLYKQTNIVKKACESVRTVRERNHNCNIRNCISLCNKHNTMDTKYCKMRTNTQATCRKMLPHPRVYVRVSLNDLLPKLKAFTIKLSHLSTTIDVKSNFNMKMEIVYFYLTII